MFYTQNLFFNHFNLKTPKNNSKISVKPFMPLNNSKHGPEKKIKKSRWNPRTSYIKSIFFIQIQDEKTH